MGDSIHNIMQYFIGLKATEIDVTSILKEIIEKKNWKILRII